MIKKNWKTPLFIALFMFGVLVSTQYSTQRALENSLVSQDQGDLVTLVKSLNEKRGQLEIEVDNLFNSKTSLDEKAAVGSNLVTSLETELKQLKLLNGAIPVHGTGILITITGDSNLMYLDLIDLVNELWVSGAEAVAINEHRITNTTTIYRAEDANHRLVITINNEPLLSPVVIKAIGNSDTLEKGLSFTGGIIDNLNTLYQVFPVIKKQEDLTISAASSKSTFKYLKW